MRRDGRLDKRDNLLEAYLFLFKLMSVALILFDKDLIVLKVFFKYLLS